jgi:hypothetical protein
MDFERINIEKLVKQTICHEWGHILASYLLYGTLRNIDRIEYEDTLFAVNGHTVSSYVFSETDENGNIPFLYFVDTTNEKEIMILLAGVIAEKICGYNKGRFSANATDKAKIERITLNKKLVCNLRKKTEDLLTPLKETLNALTERTLEKYPQTRDEDKEIHYWIFQETIIEWVNEFLPDSLKPQSVCCIKKRNPL